jgi:hypothetical protein
MLRFPKANVHCANIDHGRKSKNCTKCLSDTWCRFQLISSNVIVSEVNPGVGVTQFLDGAIILYIAESDVGGFLNGCV